MAYRAVIFYPAAGQLPFFIALAVAWGRWIGGNTVTRKDSCFETHADIMKDGNGGCSQAHNMCI